MVGKLVRQGFLCRRTTVIQRPLHRIDLQTTRAVAQASGTL
jgi:hypothetical protein